MTNRSHNFFETLSSGHKLILSLVIAAVSYAVVPTWFKTTLTHILFSWDVFCVLMLLSSWVTFYTTPSARIRQQARKEDGTRIVIFFIVLVATCVSLLAVVLILISKASTTTQKAQALPVAIVCMLLSWCLVHTIFAIRYAHLYYADHEQRKENPAGGLDFPGEDHPDFVDFAYFAFTLGMTFQVSDVEISARRIRRLAFWHSLLSFGYNATIIALTVNVIAGLTQ